MDAGLAGSYCHSRSVDEPLAPFGITRSSSKEKDDRKRKREAALTSFNSNGTIDGMASLTFSELQDVCSSSGTVSCGKPEGEYKPAVQVQVQAQPNCKGILKTRPILKGSTAKAKKKRKVVFDEETLERLEKENEKGKPSRTKLDEHNTPYHDTYHHLSSDDEKEIQGMEGRSSRRAVTTSPPPLKDGSHLTFQFNVQFNFTRPRAKSRIFKEKTKELIMEEGEMFKLMVKAKLPDPEGTGSMESMDMEEDTGFNPGSIAQILRQASAHSLSHSHSYSHSHTSAALAIGQTLEDSASSFAEATQSPSASASSLSSTSSLSSLAHTGPFDFSGNDLVGRQEKHSSFSSQASGNDPLALSPQGSSGAFIFSAPPLLAAQRSRSFTYCSGGNSS